MEGCHRREVFLGRYSWNQLFSFCPQILPTEKNVDSTNEISLREAVKGTSTCGCGAPLSLLCSQSLTIILFHWSCKTKMDCYMHVLPHSLSLASIASINIVTCPISLCSRHLIFSSVVLQLDDPGHQDFSVAAW